jgi:hypothetical protein
MSDTALSALVLAWATTLIATTLFITALAFSQGSAVYLRELERVLISDV